MITIRKATLEDIPQIVQLWTNFMENHDEIVLKRNKRLESYVIRKKTAPNNYGSFLREQLQSTGTAFIAEVDGAAVGFTLLVVKDEIPIYKIEKIGCISDLFVKEEFRGKGISSKIRDEALKWFKMQGISNISVLLYSDNPFVHSVYKKWGFFDYKIEMRREL